MRIKHSLGALLFALAAMSTTSSVTANETIVIPGTGDSQQLLRILAEQFTLEVPSIRIEIPDSVGSTGGVKAISNDQAVLARTARPLKPQERELGLTEHLFARSPVVFAAKPTMGGISNLSTQEIIDIYSGRVTNWQTLGGPNQKLYLVDREQGDSSRSVLEKNLKGFAQTTSVALVIYDTPTTANTIANNAFTLGYVPLSWAVSNKLLVLSVDGATPSPENMKNSTYPYHTPLYIVSKGAIPEEAKAFIAFLHSPSAAHKMTEFGVIPVSTIK